MHKLNILVPTLTASGSREGRMRIHGVASSTVKDRHGDTMTEKALRKMESVAVGQSVFLNHEWKLPEDLAGTVEAAQLQRAADGVHELHVDVAINESNERAVKTWEAISGGARLGISIEAMIPENSFRRDKAGGFIFDDIDLMGSSIVAHPANTRSWVDYAIKSVTGHTPDRLRVLEAERGENFFLRSVEGDADGTVATPEIEAAAEPDATESVSAETPAGVAPEVVADAAPVEVAVAADPDLTHSTTVIQHPDGTTVWVTDDAPDGDAAEDSTEKSAAQETSAEESPVTGMDGIEDDNGLDNERLLGDDVTKAMTGMAPTITDTIDGQSLLIRSLTREVGDLRSKLATAEATITRAHAERDAALEITSKTLDDTASLIARLLDSPVGRKSVALEAVGDLDRLKAIYGDAIVNTLSQTGVSSHAAR